MSPATFLASPTSSPSLQPTILSTLEKAQRCLHLDPQYPRAVTVEDHVRRRWTRILLSSTFRKEILHAVTDHLLSLSTFHDPRVHMCYILEPTQRYLPPCWRLLNPRVGMRYILEPMQRFLHPFRWGARASTFELKVH